MFLTDVLGLTSNRINSFLNWREVLTLKIRNGKYSPAKQRDVFLLPPNRKQNFNSFFLIENGSSPVCLNLLQIFKNLKPNSLLQQILLIYELD